MASQRGRRRIVLFLLLLVAGAIVNVAVAWGCVLGLPPHFNHHRLATGERPLTMFEREALLRWAFGDVEANPGQLGGITQSRFGWTEARAEWTPDGRLADGWTKLVSVTRLDAGWPMHGVRGHEEFDDRKPEDEQYRSLGAIEPADWARPRWGNWRLISFLPIYPLWPGFGINTVFYALVLWMLFAGTGALRRKRRRMRGLCVKCAYDLRGRGAAHTVCPECGTAIEHGKPTADTPKAESGSITPRNSA